MAVYSGVDVYLFDDLLSALDSHVSRKVFNTCIKDELRGQNTYLGHQSTAFSSTYGQFVLIQEEMIKEKGMYEELIRHGSLFQTLMVNAQKWKMR
ncbi:hypothetical protein SUGI_1186860 [Cryptomeria japonica]|nr:hypothetical protein SUGI_1186860 [Cryptomeria japonica]